MRPAIDASAILAVIWNEPGQEQALASLPNAVISAVNYAEVRTKMSDRGLGGSDLRELLVEMSIEVVSFDLAQAEATANLRPLTKSRGLSLGDRACLALAIGTGGIAVTADRSWATLGLPVEIEIIR